MDLKLNRLELIVNLNMLTEVKENLHNDLMNPLLKWGERMELYQSLQWINNRIDLLNQSLLKKSS